MTHFYFKLSEKTDFQKAKNGDTVDGYIKYRGIEKHGVVELGKEVEDLHNHQDKNTEYRKFIRCNIGIFDAEEKAYNKSPYRIEGIHTITIYH